MKPGIGKSSVLAKLGGSLGDAKVLRASGAEDESHLAYGLVAQLVEAGRGLGGRPSKLLARGLNDGVDPLSAGPELLGLLDTIGHGGELVVLLVDDLHWADTASARALLFVAAPAAGRTRCSSWSRPAPVSSPATAKAGTGSSPATSGRPGWSWGPSGQRTWRPSAEALGAGELSRAGATSLLQHTGGNPLYCATLLRELGAGALGHRAGGRGCPRAWRASSSSG